VQCADFFKPHLAFLREPLLIPGQRKELLCFMTTNRNERNRFISYGVAGLTLQGSNMLVSDVNILFSD
jgi:hypothetical protein